MVIAVLAKSSSMYRYTFRVEENLHGAEVYKTLQVYSGAIDGDCGFRFKLGEKYYVESGRQNGLLVTWVCSDTRLASSAGEALRKLRALRDTKFVPSIHGILRLDRMPPYGISPLDGRPVQGITLHMVGVNHTFTAQTDEKGLFRFENVPADSYYFVAELPPNLQLDSYTSGIERPYKFSENACFDVILRVNPAVPRPAAKDQVSVSPSPI